VLGDDTCLELDLRAARPVAAGTLRTLEVVESRPESNHTPSRAPGATAMPSARR
jgi:hypothetical protein